MKDAELRAYERLAQSKGMVLSEWVRQSLQQSARAEPGLARKIAALRVSVRHAFPAPDIEQMLDEISAGYISFTRFSPSTEVSIGTWA
jgi:hypothetical protein